MRIAVKNVSGALLQIHGGFTAIVSDGIDTSTQYGPLPIPSIADDREDYWSIEPGETLECITPIDPFFSENPLFLSGELPFWKPGTYSVRVEVLVPDSRTSVKSNAASLTVTIPSGDDALIWDELTQGGVLGFGLSAGSSFGTIGRYPTSEYYRHVALFVLNAMERDDDRYALNVMHAVQGLPGAYVDGARLAIAQRYSDRANGANGCNDQLAAGQWSAKGRAYTQQLIDNPASPFGAVLGKSLQPSLRTTEEWQALYDFAHTGRR